MKYYLRFSLAVSALVFAFGAIDARAQTNEILKRMDEHQKALTSLRANVLMDKFNAQLDEHDLREGTTMYLKVKSRDALARIDWIKPQQETLSVVNKKYVLYQPALNQAITGNTEKAQKKEATIFDFTKMSKEELKANYSVKFFGQEEVRGGIPTWHLELTPKSAKSYRSVDIWVDGNGMVLQTKINENNNDSTTVYLSNLQKNGNIKTNEFVINLPKGTKIINQ